MSPDASSVTVDVVIVNGGPWTRSGARRFDTFPSTVTELASGDTCEILAFSGRRVHAVAAIGNPDRFFDALETFGIDVIRHPHRDHANFTAADFEFGDSLPVLMTTKDAVKCPVPRMRNLWSVSAVTSFPAGGPLIEEILEIVRK